MFSRIREAVRRTRARWVLFFRLWRSGSPLRPAWRASKNRDITLQAAVRLAVAGTRTAKIMRWKSGVIPRVAFDLPARSEAMQRSNIERLLTVWMGQPELRLGELIVNAVEHHRLLHMDDEMLLARIEEYHSTAPDLSESEQLG